MTTIAARWHATALALAVRLGTSSAAMADEADAKNRLKEMFGYVTAQSGSICGRAVR